MESTFSIYSGVDAWDYDWYLFSAGVCGQRRRGQIAHIIRRGKVEGVVGGRMEVGEA